MNFLNATFIYSEIIYVIKFKVRFSKIKENLEFMEKFEDIIVHKMIENFYWGSLFYE